MKLKSLLVLMTLIFFLSIPVIGEQTDYQKGVNDGLAKGMRIGYMLGKAPYDTNTAQQFNSMVNPFNDWLQAIFGTNRTALNTFWMKPYNANNAKVGGQEQAPVIHELPA